MVIQPSEVTWVGNLFIDPFFCTFEYEGQYYKAVLPGHTGWASKPGAHQLLRAMSKAGFIPPTEPCDLRIDGFGTIYRQYSEFYNVAHYHRNALSEQESAVMILKFNLWLLDKGFLLRDGHGNNIVFQGAMRPYWCDLGSIDAMSNNSPLIGIEEFMRYHLFPLLLRSRSPHYASMARQSLQKGMSLELAQELLDLRMHLSPDRKLALETLLGIVQSLTFPRSKTMWGDYYGDNANEFSELSPDETSGRTGVFMRLFRALKPRHVVDMGANAGLFSRYMAAQGAEVLAVEPDENAVMLHLERLRGLNFEHTIKLQVSGLGEPVRPGDLAVALALTHHLYFTAQYPWKYIAKLLAECTTAHLLTEFMPHGLSTTGMPEEMPALYRIEAFMRQLERYFETVEIVPYPAPELSPRIFILCRDKRAVAIDDGWGTFPVDG